MATFRKRLGKWEVRVRRCSNKTISRTFIEKGDAHKWAREVENKIEKGLYEDLSHANSITLRELLQQYRDDVSSTKKGFEEEKYKINKLCKNPRLKFWQKNLRGCSWCPTLHIAHCYYRQLLKYLFPLQP